MRLDRAFLKLPKAYCAETLAAEVRALPASASVPHPGNYAGNDAVLLVTPQGELSNGFNGPMAPTEHLRACPYMMEVMADLGAVWGRSRLMGLMPSSVVPAHVDVNYHWRTHIRIHIPVITNPNVIFTVDDESVHMKPGECWTFDSFRMHNVHNGGTEKRVHLVLDTVGGEEVWDLMEQADQPDGPAPKLLQPGETSIDRLRFERVNSPRIMSPWEVRAHIVYIGEHMAPDPRLAKALGRLDRFLAAWTALWAQYGDEDQHIVHYRKLIGDFQRELLTGGGDLRLTNKVPLSRALNELVFQVALPAPRAGPAPVRLAS